jgi:hypothetical protein
MLAEAVCSHDIMLADFLRSHHFLATSYRKILIVYIPRVAFLIGCVIL